MDKNQLKHIIKEEYHNVKSFMEDKYGFTPELGKVISNPYAKSFVNEVQEPEVISQLRNILKNKQNAKIKDPKSGKMMRVDSFSASAVIAVYDAINDSNKKNFGKLSLPKMVNVAFKVAKVRKENAVNNHDGKAAPYGSGYKKVNENEEYVAYATKGKKVVKTIRDSEYNDDLFSKFKKDMERKGLDVYIDLVKNRKVVRQVYRTNESVNEKISRGQLMSFNKLVDKGENVVVHGKNGKRYIYQNSDDLKSVRVKDGVLPLNKIKKITIESLNEILVIVDKFDKKKQSYGKIYYKDGGNRIGDGDLKKANKELEKLSKKHKGLTLVSVGRNSKMYDVHNPRESVNEAKYKHTYKSITDQQKDLKRIFPSGHPRVSVRAYHDINPQGRMKTSYVEIEGPSSYVDAYKKMAFNGKGTMRDVIKFVEKNESVNEAFIVLYAPKKGVKPVTTAAYKDKKDAEKWAKDLGGVTMIVKKKVKGIDEGKKRYYQQDRVGSAKYVINYHDGKKTHKDGSDFFDIQTFKNKKDLAKFVNTLHKAGYVYGFNESLNERLFVPSAFDKVLDRLKFNQFTPKNIKKLADKFKVDYEDAVEYIKQNKVINVADKPTMAEGVFSNLDLIRQNSKNARDFVKNVFSDPDFKDMKNDREFLKYLKSIYEGFASDAQRRAAFASGYKAKGKKGKKKESIEEYDVENYQDVNEFVEFMKEYKSDVNEAEYQGRDVKLGKIMQGDVKKFKVYVKNPKGNVVKVNFGHKGKGGEKTMRIKKSDPERRKAFRARHNCDNPGPRHKARYWACRTW